jgi:hypothetical protein
MKPWIKHFILLAIATFMLSITGCKSLLHLKYGMKQPMEETQQSLQTFLEKHHFPLNDQYILRDSSAFIRLMQNKTFNKRALGYFIFNSEGDLLGRDSLKCQWATYVEIAELHPDSSYHLEPGLNVDNILGSIVPLVNTDSFTRVATNSKFTVVVTWAKYLGKINQQLFGFDKALLANQTTSIRWIWLNMDMQQSWGLEEKMKFHIR